jgi:hypothetical protein
MTYRKDQQIRFRLSADSDWQPGTFIARMPGADSRDDPRARVHAQDGTLLKVQLSDIRSAERTLTDQQVNQYANFLSYASPEENNDAEALPCIELGGDENGDGAVQVYAYAEDGAVIVSLHFDTAGPTEEDGTGPWAYYGEDGQNIPVVVKMGGGEPVWQATEGANPAGQTIAQAVYAAYRNGWKDRSLFRVASPAELREIRRRHVAGFSEPPPEEDEIPAWLAYAGVPLTRIPEGLRDSVREHRENEAGLGDYPGDLS